MFIVIVGILARPCRFRAAWALTAAGSGRTTDTIADSHSHKCKDPRNAALAWRKTISTMFELFIPYVTLYLRA